MTQQLQDTVARIQDDPEYHDNVSAEFEHDGNFIPPEIMFYPGRAQGKLGTTEVTSDVIDVYIARSSTHAIKYLLEASTESLHRPLDVVPRNFKYHQPDIYAKLLSTQNDYLAKHRNIGLVAIPIDAMHHQKVKDIDRKEWTSMYTALCHGPDIVQIHASKRTFDIGKWNISTTHDSWEAVKAWLDKHLLALYNSIPANVRHTYPSYRDFPEPTYERTYTCE
jgi:hypothetical protein